MYLSIIVVSFNTVEITLKSLTSIWNSNIQSDFEVIVVDNASSDTSVAQMRHRFGKKENFRLLTNSANLGFAKANNQALGVSTGTYKLLLNSDVIVKNGSIDKLVAFAQKHTIDAGAVVPKLLNIDGSVQPSAYRLPTLGRTIEEYWMGKTGLLDKYSPKSKTVEAATMAAFLLTPKALAKVGFLNEKYFMYFEDLDYCRKLAKVGLKIYFLIESEMIHYHGQSGKNLAKPEEQWRRLVPSSRIYYGWVVHYLIFFIIWLSQKSKKIFSS